jgi:hypothetical protein
MTSEQQTLDALEEASNSIVVRPPQSGAELLEYKPKGANRVFDPDTQDTIWRFASICSRSHLVKPHFRGPVNSEGHANCFMALSLAMELDIPWLQALNNIHIVKGNIGFSGQLYIAVANRRSPIKGRIMYEEGGKGDDMYCTAYAKDTTGERCEYKLLLSDIKKLDCYRTNKNWQSITKLMLRYRAASYLVRTYFPEAMLGISTTEELEDTYGSESGGAEDLNEILSAP